MLETWNINGSAGTLLLQTSGSEIRIGAQGQIGIAGANYGTSGQVLTVKVLVLLQLETVQEQQ